MKVVESECNRRSYKAKGSWLVIKKKAKRCRKYFKTLVEKGKDVKEILKLQKLKREENKQNGELSKRLDLLEEKTESELHAQPHISIFGSKHIARTCALCPKFKCSHTHMLLILIFLKVFFCCFLSIRVFDEKIAINQKRNRKVLNLSIK